MTSQRRWPDIAIGHRDPPVGGSTPEAHPWQHFQNRCLEAERGDQPLPFLQAQWILTSRRPQQIFEELGCQPLAGCPAGFYRILTAALRLYVVVLPELPRQRDTLLLRLLGGRDLRQEAIAEIRRIEADDPDGAALLSLLACVQVIIDRDPRIPRQEKEEFMLAIKQEFEKFKQGLRAEARADALTEGVKRASKRASKRARRRPSSRSCKRVAWR